MSQLIKDLHDRIMLALEVSTLNVESRILLEAMVKICNVVKALETPEEV